MDGPDESTFRHPYRPVQLRRTAFLYAPCRPAGRLDAVWNQGRIRQLSGRAEGPAQGGVWHEQHIPMVTGFDLQVRRQIGQKFTIRVDMVDLAVGDDVLGHGSVEPDLVDHAIKDLVSKKALTVKITGWPSWILPMSASFTDAQTWMPWESLVIQHRLEAPCAGNDSLTDVDTPVHDNAVDRRLNGTICEGFLVPFQFPPACATLAAATYSPQPCPG